MWPKEDIPDTHRLFMRVHIKTYTHNGLPVAGAFKNHDGGMSTDREKYATAADTRARGRKLASEYGVVQVLAGKVREIPSQTVEHKPLYPDNRAHTDVLGEKDEEARTLLRRFSSWIIPPP